MSGKSNAVAEARVLDDGDLDGIAGGGKLQSWHWGERRLQQAKPPIPSGANTPGIPPTPAK